MMDTALRTGRTTPEIGQIGIKSYIVTSFIQGDKHGHNRIQTNTLEYAVKGWTYEHITNI